MFKSKKFLSVFLSLVLLLNISAVLTVAAPGDPEAVAVNAALKVGRLSGDVFTPLSVGETIAKDEIITVRISPKTDFLAGASSYVVMFDKNAFALDGAPSAAFTANSENTYYNTVCSGHNGFNLPAAAWPATFAGGEKDLYNAVRVTTTLKSGASPAVIPGDWLFSFGLKALKNINSGDDARIWMDARWFRASGTATNLPAFIMKCENGTLAAQGKTTYDFSFDFLDADLTLPLVAQVPKSTLTFESDGGSNVPPMRGDVGSPLTPPANPIKTGFTFLRWEPELPATFPEEDTTYTAIWTPVRSKITFDSNGGSDVAPIEGDYGSPVTPPAPPTKDGYNFASWIPALPETFPEEDITVTAQWTVKQVTVTFNSNGGTPVASKTGDFGSALVAPAPPTRVGYTFLGWEPALPATYPSSDLNVVAQWKKKIVVSFDTAGGSPIGAIMGDEGSPLTLPADPRKSGYTFDGWDPQAPDVFPAQDITLTAKWKINNITISFNSNGGTEIEPISGDYGTPVTPPEAPTRAGYNFVGWSPEIPESFPPQDITLEAQWEAIEYYVNILYDGEPIEDELVIELPWLTTYRSIRYKLDYETNVEDIGRVEYISSGFNVIIDKEGNVTNKGFFVRSTIITVNIYDGNGDLAATKDVRITLKKTIVEVISAWVQKILAVIIPLFQKIANK
ncbi:MAG: InlB B-repeat-containing protein [Acutalibacteraceae bacterium]|jgi:hypothetical protein